MTREQYLDLLAEARTSDAPWRIVEQHTHELIVGDLNLRLAHSPERTTWLLHAGQELMAHGHEPTLATAKSLGLQHAEHYVRTIIDAEATPQ